MEIAYAQALWKMVEDGMMPSKAVHALKDTLLASGRESLLPRIAHAFERLALRESQRAGLVLTIAREKDERSAHKAAKEILASLGFDKVDLKTQVDDTLIGGWRLEGGEHLVDASYKQQLLDIYNRAVNA